jgi:hypothetical protein
MKKTLRIALLTFAMSTTMPAVAVDHSYSLTGIAN